MHTLVQDAIKHAQDPLGFNVVGQTHALLLKIRQNIQSAQDRLCLEGLLAQPPISTVSQALKAVSNLLAVPVFTLVVADLFQPLLIDLCARWIDNDQLDEVTRFTSLCLLVEPYEEIFPVLAAYLSRKSLKDGPLAFIGQQGLTLAAVPTPHLQSILLAYYRLLGADPDLPTRLGWSADLLQSIYHPISKEVSSPHPDRTARWLAIRCFAIQTCLPEATREKLEIEFVGTAAEPLPLCIGQELGLDQNGSSLTARDMIIDAWIFPLTETRRIQLKRDELANSSTRGFFSNSEPEVRATEGDLHSRIVNVSGILLYSDLPISNRSGLSEYVPTTTTNNALRALALYVSQRVPTLLTATPASGKMTLIRELASRIHPDGERGLVTLQLGDTALDAKSLIGSYISATTSEKSAAGFVWQDGAIPRALRAGKWLVLADVDRASTEVLATLLPLIESMRPGKHIGELASLDLGGGRGRVQGSPTFMIFGMRSVTKVDVDGHRAYTPPTFFGHKHWLEVQLIPPTADDLVTIVERRFPGLGPSASRVAVEFWQAMCSVAKSLTKVRDIGMRDLEKFCARLERSLPVSSPGVSFAQLFPNHIIREEILLEARDVFFAAYEHGTPQFTAFSTRAAQALDLDSERASSTLMNRTPEYVARKSGEVVVGRSQFSPKRTSASPETHNSQPFAIHRPALVLFETLAASVSTRESLLLVGETGTGKTTSVQRAAELTCTPLVVLNLSNQSEASDLLGGFKPVDARVPAGRIQETFIELFVAAFSRKKNKAFEDAVRAAYVGGKWTRVVKLWREAGKMAGIDAARSTDEGERDQTEGPRKRRRIGPEWDAFMRAVDEFDAAHVRGHSKFVFSFVEGPLVTALRNGHWVLLDEINLASAEMLECVASILQGPHGSVTLTEAGHLEPVPRHPDFRLFACMNPATDAGKKDLPPNIRSRFTELYVPPPDADEAALRSIVTQYIGHCALGDKTAITNVADFYIAAKHLTTTRQLADGQNHVPHFSMRTLARALTFTSDMRSTLGLRRALWEGVSMAFMMTLDEKSVSLLRAAAEKHILEGVKNISALLSQPVPAPDKDNSKYIQVGSFWLLRGPESVQSAGDYILTPSVETKLVDLARIVTTRRFPVLIEGPTSSGKTSSVEYLAKLTGHRFVRINNHEHTDLQEYLGSYLTDPVTGKLKFQDGILVRALRAGDWIVLDELNLAPTDVLEALNRLLDDNRELVVPETNEVIRPHPNFMLFATQNPPGLYAGRKILSRAFRNRFLEVHFGDLPQDELETILCQRCRIAQSHGRKIVAVFQELQKRRQAGRVFETKNGFATLRDLFRWANRHSEGYTENSTGGNYQHLAEQGFMLLAERARRTDDRAVVKAVIEETMKVKIDEKALYDLSAPGAQQRIGVLTPKGSGVVWTSAMRRLYTLVASALRYDEPVLLVGETGSGKTSVCELLSLALGRSLHSLSCHQNTETADLLGSQRPIRNRTTLRDTAIAETAKLLREMGLVSPHVTFEDLDRTVEFTETALKQCSSEQSTELRRALVSLRRSMALFEWYDGPLIKAMQGGGLFLLDEISLADDSVLERLNSVLEPSRTVVLAEKGGSDISHLTVVAAPGFQLVATMNPGGDYGKKELSPALRNRFTEIWVPHVEEREDLEQIIHHSWKDYRLRTYTSKLLDFAGYVEQTLKDKNVLGLRDLLAWVSFSNFCASSTTMALDLIFHHAARLTILDGVATFSSVAALPVREVNKICRTLERKLHELVSLSTDLLLSMQALEITVLDSRLCIGSFSVDLGKLPCTTNGFSLQAPTTYMNASRVVRALQITKPLLLEGSPGVGKTSLIVALAAMSGHSLCRINLSEQTDLMDLFGSDMPTEGGHPGEFAWRDAAFLRAMQNGDWVLLDEMNLAPQAVLEGLNAVLDHRGTVFIPELGREFTKHANFRVFAAQNPLAQGGGRKGLPKSFINRFTKVYVEALSQDDLRIICRLVDSNIAAEDLEKMLAFNERLSQEVVDRARFGREGSPWEFNLRDILRWIALWKSTGLPASRYPTEYIGDAYLSRFRSRDDQLAARALYSETDAATNFHKTMSVGLDQVQFGHTFSGRRINNIRVPSLALLRDQSANLETASKCVESGWLLIVNGPSQSGKTSLVRTLAALRGADLLEHCINTGTDTGDLLGGFEHSSWELKVERLAARVRTFLHRTLAATGIMASTLDTLLSPAINQGDRFIGILRDIHADLENSPTPDSIVLAAEIDEFLHEDLASAGHFEWVDGPLVRAMKQGSWIVLDHCNLCSPAVLDRLNSLCEAGGVLVLSERGNIDGEIPVIIPHPDFRLFMLSNPRYGELSRAMRNRGVEVSISPVENKFDIARIRQCARLHGAYSGEQDSLVEDMAMAQLSRRGLTVIDSVAAHFGPTITTGSLTLATRDYKAYNSLQVLGLLHQVSQADLKAHHWISTLLFLITSISREELHKLPQYLRVFDHSLPSSETLLQIFNQGFLDSCDNLRVRTGNLRGVSSRFLSSQPVILHLNPNIMSPAFAPESYLESMVSDSALEVLVRIHLSPAMHPLTSAPTSNQISILDKSRLMWGGLGAGITAPRCVRSIAPLISALRAACATALNSAKTFETQHVIDSIRVLADCADVLQAISETPFVDFAAIRTLVQLISQPFEDLSFPRSAFKETLAIANNLLQDTSINSGRAMLPIWATMQMLKPSKDSEDKASQMFAYLAQQSQVPNNIRRRGLDIAAMLHLADSTELVECASSIVIAGGSRVATTDDSHCPKTDYQELCALTLDMIAATVTRKSSSHMNEAFLDAVCCSPRAELHSYTYLRLLMWERDFFEGIQVPSVSLPAPHSLILSLSGYSVPTLLGSHLEWMRNCWSLPSEEITPDPGSILRSLEHSACSKRCNASTIRLGNWHEYENALRIQTSHLKLQAHSVCNNKLMSLATVWVHSASLVFAAFHSETTQEEQAHLVDLQNRLSQLQDMRLIYHIILELVEFLEKCRAPLLAHVAGKHLASLRSYTLSAQIDDLELASFLGEAWIGSAYALIELYFPEIPMDPLGGQNCQSLVWELRANWLRTHLDTLTLGQSIVHSANYEPTLKHLRNQLDTAHSQHEFLKPNIVRGADHLQQLTELFIETQAFLTQAVDRARISQLVSSIKANVGVKELSQEEMIQGTITTFLHRLSGSYPTLTDIILPLEYALHQLKLGLRIHTSASQHRLSDRNSVSDAAELLLHKPTAQGCQKLLESELATLVTATSASTSTAEWIVAKITALLLSESICQAPHSALENLIELYDQFLHLWLSQKAREARADQEGQSLYKQNKTNSADISEEEELEKEFNELFPSFDDILGGKEFVEPPCAEAIRSAVSVNNVDVHAVYQIHNIWADLSPNFQTSSSSLRSAYAITSSTILHQIMQIYEASLNAEVDAEGFYQRVRLTRISLDSLALNTNSTFDFYRDSNISELSKAARLLDTFRARLDGLIAEWPDQMVLRHLYERSQAISQFRLDTPLAQVLSALEQLLLQTDNWETYANKDNTIKAQQQQLADLIVDWRRLELKCWSTLLDREMSSCVNAVSSWWPQLYESIVSVAASLEGDSSKTADHLQQLVPLLDSYLTQSPLGQFEPRLSLLRSFAKLAHHLSVNSKVPNSFASVSDLLDTLSLQYLEALPSVQNSVAKQRANVNKEINDFIKLASWKDTNVHALKQSAERTHRVLHKCIRKFRSIIRQPVTNFFGLQTPSDPALRQETNQESDSSIPIIIAVARIETSPSSPLQKINIELALQKYQLHATHSGRQLVRSGGTEIARTLAARIAVESKELAEAPIPDSDARERHVKVLVSRKRRAWSELLKELRRLGLAAAVTTEILLQQEDRAALLLLSLGTETSYLFSDAIAGANKQFVRLLRIMPDMRASFRQHHSDISTRDFRRASNLVESSFSIVIEARKTLKTSLAAYTQVHTRLDRMINIRKCVSDGDTILGVGAKFTYSVKSLREIIGRVRFALIELVDDVANYEAVTQDSAISSFTKESIGRSVNESTEILATITDLERCCSSLSTPVWTKAETSVLSRGRAFLSDVKAAFNEIVSHPANPPRLFLPVHGWLQSVEIAEQNNSIAGGMVGLPLFADEIISKLLIGMQTIVTNRTPTSNDLPDDEVPDNSLRTAAQHVQKTALVLGIEEIDRLVTVFTDNVAYMDENQITYSIDRLTPFLQTYLHLVRESLFETLSWLNSISHLTCVLASTVRNLMQNGFCKPPDIQEEPEGKTNGQELTEGTGMGEGAGAENISNQIEDEAQVEGLQGEQESDSKGEKNDDDKEAIEMSEDFTGAMEDVSDTEDDGQGDSESGSDADPEERIEDLDSGDPNVIDEKLWNDESAEDKPEGQDQAGDDNAAQTGEKSETAAKEDKPQKATERKDKHDAGEDEDILGSETASAAGEERGMEEEESGQLPEDGRNMDDFVPEANTLDLPDDLDLGPNDETAKTEGSEDGIEDEDEDAVMEDQDSVDGQEGQQKSQEPEPFSEADVDVTTADPDTANDDPLPQDKEESLEIGLGRQDAKGENTEEADITEHGDRGGQRPGEAQGEGKSGGDEQEEHGLEAKDAPETDPEHSATEANEPKASAKGDAGARAKATDASQQQDQQSSNLDIPNPIRSLGDASKEIQRRVDQILNRQDASQTFDEPSQLENAPEVEYAEDNDAGLDMQALGPSNDTDEATKLRDLRINDVSAPAFEDKSADVDMQLDTTPQVPNEEYVRQQDNQATSLQPALTAKEVMRSKTETLGQDTNNEQSEMESVVGNDASLEPEPTIDSDKLEALVTEWQAQGHPVEGAEEIWRLYESLTQDLSHSLCEQLRLVLAPTRATRLRGDFRTGKRLNMKKLVPYVASDFTRDKIWLRRTRPAAREYQVLLAVDDSRSMARASHTIHLTRQALALVARALEKLEVGELALARFGREVEVVHEFGAGVLRGGDALGKFTFDQPATDVLRLIESSLHVLSSARERSSGSSDLWQLEIVISDGICQDHERLRTVLRKAEEERVMIVFVVIDAPGQNGTEASSIVSMLQPTIKTINGRMDIQMERYLDSFPFQYFVVLRDVEALPSILADTLRQFFERISED